MNNIGKQFLLLAIIFQSVSLYCQTPQLNLDKYWNYRNSLFEKFIVDCDPANLPSGQTANGINIPATVYNPTGDGTNEYSVSWGDATIELAHYIMALATEYGLLKTHNQSVANAEEKIYRAFDAINRLDNTAEPRYGCGTAYVNHADYTNINGFFIRDDVDANFFNYWSQNGMTSWQQLSDFKSDYSNSDIRVAEMSQDQVWHLLLGLAFVKNFVDVSSLYEDLPGRYANLRDQSMIKSMRFLNFMQEYSNSYGWQWCSKAEDCYPGYWPDWGTWTIGNYRIKNPCTAVNVLRGGSVADLTPMIFQFEGAVRWITDSDSIDVTFNSTPRGIGAYPIPFSPNFFTNTGTLILNTIGNQVHGEDLTSLFLSLRKFAHFFNQNISGNPYELKYFWLDHLPMTSVLLHNENALTPIFNYYYSHIENLLDSAPFDGPYREEYPAIERKVWAQPSMLGQPYGSFISEGRVDLFGEYNGLDYMILFNLYHLVHDKLFNYGLVLSEDYPQTYSYQTDYFGDDGSIDIAHESNASTYTRISKSLIRINSTIHSDGKLRIRGNEVILDSGFEVEDGGEFTAEINVLMNLDFTPPVGNYKSAITTSNLSPKTDVSKNKKIEIEEDAFSHLRLYPNPANNYINIESPVQISNVMIYNSSGTVINQTCIDNYGILNLDVSDYHPGIYFISVINKDGNSEVKKVVVE